jgi:hypothetical protein
MIQKNSLSNKKYALKQIRFIETLEGIGDILIFETKFRKNKDVIEGLGNITDIIKKFLSIQKDDPDKFERLLLSQEFFELYKKNKKEAELRLAFYPEKQLISFSTAVNQILRIHEAAIEVKNNEISIHAAYNLYRLLDDFSRTTNNDLFVNQILEKLLDITKIAIKYQDNSMYTSSINWYIRIVFRNNIKKEDSFNLAYLKLFDKNFFSSIKYIISENQISLFKGLVSSLVDGLNISHGLIPKIEKYIRCFISPDRKKFIELNKSEFIENKKKELEGSVSDLDNEDKLFEWLKRFNEIKEILHINFFQDFDQKQKKECKEKEENIINSITTEFKYNNLLEIVFAIGAYCLFKKKYDFIKCLWEYKQPADADASWVGHDIIPNNVDQVISLYFGKYLLERKFDFWEDHHGSEIYYKEYFLLLLARVLKNIKINSEGKYEQLEKYHLPKLNIYRISDLEHSIDELIETANKIKDREKTLSILGFDIENINELFDNKLIYFLKILKEKAQKKIEEIRRVGNISSDKVNKFKEDVIKGFNEAIVLRDIFKHYKLYESKIEEKYDGDLKRFGPNMVNDKAAFFDEWHIQYLDLGIDYGRNLASGEDLEIIEKIVNNCKEIKGKDIDKILNKFNDLLNIIIFTINLDLFDFFTDSDNFIISWSGDSPQSNVQGFAGRYIFNKKEIPVYEIFQDNINKQILVLDKMKLGKLIQFSPLKEGESENLMKDIFYMNIQSFSETKELMDSFIKDPPDFLKKIGDEKKQREHLQEKALIQIFERFEYVKDIEFQGYSLNLKST